jgi:hypothetical protein
VPVILANQASLDNTCKLMGARAGVISVADAGQTTHEIP